MASSRKRRSPLEIIDSLYDALAPRRYDPVKTVAARAELDGKTAARYLALIAHVEEKQKGDWLIRKPSGKKGFVYSRKQKPGAGAPRKPRETE